MYNIGYRLGRRSDRVLGKKVEAVYRWKVGDQ